MALSIPVNICNTKFTVISRNGSVTNDIYKFTMSVFICLLVSSTCIHYIDWHVEITQERT